MRRGGGEYLLQAKGNREAVRRHWGVENQNHWRRDACLLEDLKSHRGKHPNICAAFLLTRSVLLALNADWGTGNINDLMAKLTASLPAVWSLVMRGKTTCRGLARRPPSRKTAAQ